MSIIIYILFVTFGVTALHNILVYNLNTVGISGYVSILCLLLIEFIALFYNIKNIKHIFCLRINTIIFIWCAYTFLVTLLTSQDLFFDIRSLLWWPSVYFVFFYLAANDYSEKKINSFIKFFVPILFIITIVLFVNLRQHSLYSTNGAFEADNSVFFILTLLPLIFLLPLKIKYIFLFFAICAAFYSFKRSATLYTALIILVSIYFDFYYHKNASFLKTIVLPCILMIGLYVGIEYLNNATEGFLFDRFQNISEDKGSGRLDIWDNVIDRFSYNSIEYKIIGSGFNAVNKIFPLSAHNDFLEMLYDYGIIGLVIYLSFVLLMIKSAFKSKILGDNYFQASIILLIIFFIMSMVSHLWLYPSFYAYLIAFLGIINGKMYLKDRKIRL